MQNVLYPRSAFGDNKLREDIARFFAMDYRLTAATSRSGTCGVTAMPPDITAGGIYYLAAQTNARMFIGHFAVGMAGKKADASVSLGTLIFAAQFLDLLWPTLLLLNLEHVVIQPGISEVTPLKFSHYPISHSLLVVFGWAGLFVVVYYVLTRKRRAALLLGLLVVSHWLLDVVVHIPDLPLYPGNSPKFGLGLWNSPLLTVVVEGAIFSAGVILYVRAIRAQGRNVSWWFWSLVVFLLLIYAMNLVGPPPPSVEAIAWAGQLQWLFVLWGWWADRKSHAVDQSQ